MPTMFIWANMVNENGLHSSFPVKCEWFSDLHEWQGEDGKLFVGKLGRDAGEDRIVFASENLKEVEAWTQGVRDAISVISNGAKLSVKR